MSLKLSIPSAEIADTSAKPYTVYNIVVRLPLRENTIKKRYSEFLDFHSKLTSSTGSAPPLNLPPKSIFTRTIKNPSLTEDRRVGLENYLLAILESSDPRWRNSAEWRQFLNLPASWTALSNSLSGRSSNGTNSTGGGIASIAATGQPISDPQLWLDVHRELKTLLHDARLFLSKRDQAVSTTELHESSAGAKRCLIKAGGIIRALDEGLKVISEPQPQEPQSTSSSLDKATTGGSGWGRMIHTGSSNQLGEGEIRRRRDLIASAKKEREGLESLANSLTTKRVSATNNTVAASSTDRTALFGDGHNSRGAVSRRVLGGPIPETERTRELDNTGVLQLQKEIIKEQDQGMESLLKTVLVQKELSHRIGTELAEQNLLLDSVDQDVTRLEGKIKIGNRRINKIS